MSLGRKLGRSEEKGFKVGCVRSLDTGGVSASPQCFH